MNGKDDKIKFICKVCGCYVECRMNPYNGFDPDSTWTIKCPSCGCDMRRKEKKDA